MPGLDLLDLQTEFAVDKTTRLRTVTDVETGLALRGYGVHYGHTVSSPDVQELSFSLLRRQKHLTKPPGALRTWRI